MNYSDILKRPELIIPRQEDRNKGKRKIGFWRRTNRPIEGGVHAAMPWTDDAPDTLPFPAVNSARGNQWAVIAAIKQLQERSKVEEFMGWSECRLCGCANGSREYSHGPYVWPEGYCHYLEEHNVAVDPGFAEYALRECPQNMSEFLTKPGKTVRKVGFWRHMKDIGVDPNIDSPFVLPYPKSNSAKGDQVAIIDAIKRLEQRASVAVFDGWSSCRICRCVNGTREFTHGPFVWPEGYCHYLEAHRVAVDPVFASYVLSQV